MSLSLLVQFAPSHYMDQKVNHPMFYVSKAESESQIYRVHAIGDRRYVIENKRMKFNFNAPRNPVGEAFEIPLTSMSQELSAEDFAKLLADHPEPRFMQGCCQWWVMNNLGKLEDSGYVKSGTAMALLADPRMDSTRLMEYQAPKEELKATLCLSLVPEGLSADDKGGLEGLMSDINGAVIKPTSGTGLFDSPSNVNPEHYI